MDFPTPNQLRVNELSHIF